MTDRRSIEKIIKKTVQDYKKGSKNIDEASLILSKYTNLKAGIIKCFLLPMKRSNVIEPNFSRNQTKIKATLEFTGKMEVSDEV